MPLSWIYSKITGLRNRFYDRDVFETVDLGLPTISVGNLTTGGTGKTPLVAYIAKIMIEREENVCILTRGYRRADPKSRVLVSDGERIVAEPLNAGDEPYEMAQRLRGNAVIIADKDRVSAAEWAKAKFGVTIFVLDDGFQHRRVKRGVDIVCVDATDPWGGGKTLPVGRLREPPTTLARASIVVITRSDMVASTGGLRDQIALSAPDARVFEARNRVSRIAGLASFQTSEVIPDLQLPQPAFAFCGIGNPRNFFDLLQKENIRLAGTRAFRDHHKYFQADIAEIEREATGLGASCLITTGKDAVKLDKMSFSLPCFVIEIEMVIDKAAEFQALI
jgi:tetraacyldisaccharide 4'-kinase